MRRSSDRLPIVLTLAAFVLLFIAESANERLAEGWVLTQIEPWVSDAAGELLERFLALALAGLLILYVLWTVYRYARREFAWRLEQPAQPAARRVRPQRDVWLYDAICRIFLGRWDNIPLKRGRLDLEAADLPILHELTTRHIRQLAAEGRLPIWGKRRGNWALWELAAPEFWKHHQVDYPSFLEADPRVLHALPCNGQAQAASLGELMTSKAAVDAFCESVAL
jgi:hypothetical protein